MLNDFITLYLYGIYAFRKGRLTPSEAMQKVVQLSRLMEKAALMGKEMQKRFADCGKKSH